MNHCKVSSSVARFRLYSDHLRRLPEHFHPLGGTSPPLAGPAPGPAPAPPILRDLPPGFSQLLLPLGPPLVLIVSHRTVGTFLGSCRDHSSHPRWRLSPNRCPWSFLCLRLPPLSVIINKKMERGAETLRAEGVLCAGWWFVWFWS